MSVEQMTQRCSWPGTDDLMIQYHDKEWGTPLHDDQKLFEFMVLDNFQAGLSWKTILHRREGFREAFANFKPETVAAFSEKEIAKLQNDSRIIRNRLKIQATITNAQLFLGIQKEWGTFDRFIWQFTEGKVIQNHLRPTDPHPVTSKESDAMSQVLKKKGFKFAGSTICYAFMQAAGMVNDHQQHCFRYKELI